VGEEEEEEALERIAAPAEGTLAAVAMNNLLAAVDAESGELS
jgi:hypothetical protein